jgi:hypothetical protein
MSKMAGQSRSYHSTELSLLGRRYIRLRALGHLGQGFPFILALQVAHHGGNLDAQP